MKKSAAVILLLSAAMLLGCVPGPRSGPAVTSVSPAVSSTADAAQAIPTDSASMPETATPTPGPTPTPTPEPTPEPTAIPTPTPVPPTKPTPEPQPMTREEVDALLRENNAVCGVAYLGRSPDSLAVGAPALLAVGGYNWRYPFLGESKNVQLVEWNGSEVYAIIPRSDATVSIYDFYLNTDYSFTDGPGAFIASSQGWQPMLLRCNDSVTMPNTMLIVDTPGAAQVRFIPWSTFSDAPLIDPDSRILDLTVYDFEIG